MRATVGKPLLRDQERARLAYTKVGEIARSNRSERDDYKIAVRGLNTNLRCLGLAATLSLLEADGRAGVKLREHIAAANIPGLGADGGRVASNARELQDLALYMLASRDLLRLAVWLNRAVQALLGETADAT